VIKTVLIEIKDNVWELFKKSETLWNAVFDDRSPLTQDKLIKSLESILIELSIDYVKD